MSKRPSSSDVLLAAFSFACVVVVGLASVGWLSLAGSVRLGLYPLYSLAAATGWLMGNLYVQRSRRSERRWHPRLLIFTLLLPVGPFFLVRAMAPLADQAAAPFVPWYCAGVLFVFFLVPVSLRPRTPPRRPRIGRDRSEPP